MHRTWINLLSTIAGNDTERILEEVKRGEKASLNEYSDILNEVEMVLPLSSEKLLIKPRDEIRAALNISHMY
jgi:hypothetical protein